MATRIYCPRCEWKPQAFDRWQCVPSCGTVWNTFETGGRCPGCGKQWQTTQCLDCHVYSLHEAWYHEEHPAKADEEREAQSASEELVGVASRAASALRGRAPRQNNSPTGENRL